MESNDTIAGLLCFQGQHIFSNGRCPMWDMVVCGALTPCWSDCRAPQRKSSRLAQENNQPNRRESLDALSQPANTIEANVEQRRKSLQALSLR